MRPSEEIRREEELLEERTDASPAQTAEQEEHVLHLWEPFSFRLDENYDYLREGFLSRANTRFWRTLCTGILYLCTKVFLGARIRGREHLKELKGRGFVSVCNHVHPVDCTLVDRALFAKQMYYVTLASNFKIPVARHLIRLFGGVPLPRETHGVNRMFSVLGEAISGGACVQIYPEAVLRPYETTLHRFYDGAFRLAVTQNAPLVPMVITYRAPQGLYRLYKRKPCLSLEILPPLFPGDESKMRDEVNALREACRGAMQKAISNAGKPE